LVGEADEEETGLIDSGAIVIEELAPGLKDRRIPADSSADTDAPRLGTRLTPDTTLIAGADDATPDETGLEAKLPVRTATALGDTSLETITISI
jgi:hypothetical protein